MSAVAHNTAMRSSQLTHDNAYPYNDAAEREDELADELADAIKRDPSFIGEALQEDSTDLVAGYLAGDGQAVMDALSDMIDGWLAAQVRNQASRRDYISADYPRSEYERVRNVANAYGVAA